MENGGNDRTSFESGRDGEKNDQSVTEQQETEALIGNLSVSDNGGSKRDAVDKKNNYRRQRRKGCTTLFLFSVGGLLALSILLLAGLLLGGASSKTTDKESTSSAKPFSSESNHSAAVKAHYSPPKVAGPLFNQSEDLNISGGDLLSPNATNVSSTPNEELPRDEIVGDLPKISSADPRQSLRDKQLQNYLNGTALLLNFHITHHGGTAVCLWATYNGPTPSFACMGGDEVSKELKLVSQPWSADETDELIHKWRENFHFLSWEFDVHTLFRSVNDTDWDNENLVSMIVVRNPLSRLLSGKVSAKTPDEMWQYANDMRTDNYALRTIMSHEGCCQGANTSVEYLETAKTYIKRFTFIIDVECLDESLAKISTMLNLTMPPNMDIYKTKTESEIRPSPRERIGNDTIYVHLVKKNVQDLKLYEWSRKRALVKCVPRLPIINLTGLNFEMNLLH